MAWDYAEANLFADAGRRFRQDGDWIATEVLHKGGLGASGPCVFKQMRQTLTVSQPIESVSTDPPYYDNIGYADLSDFFYVWLRRSLRPVFPDLFATVAVPEGRRTCGNTISSRRQGESRKRSSSMA